MVNTIIYDSGDHNNNSNKNYHNKYSRVKKQSKKNLCKWLRVNDFDRKSFVNNRIVQLAASFWSISIFWHYGEMGWMVNAEDIVFQDGQQQKHMPRPTEQEKKRYTEAPR